MDFELSEEQKQIQKLAAEFAEGEFKKDIILKCEREETFPFEIWKKACDLGLTGIRFSKEEGGAGLGVLENVLAIEQFCIKDSGVGMTMSCALPGAELVSLFGTKEQKEKYIVPFLKGDKYFCIGITEPDHGCDVKTLSTTAVKHGDEYVINGAKTFISYGNFSDFNPIFCQTDSKAGYRGQTIIMVEKGAKGFESLHIPDKMGARMTPSAQLFFDNVHVPVENRVGQENKGFPLFMGTMVASRIEMAAQTLGISQGALNRAIEYSKQRQQYGAPINKLEIIRFKLAEMAILVAAIRPLVYQAAWAFDHGKTDLRQTAIAKVFAAEAALKVTDEAMRVMGGYGYLLEYEAERYYRDARAHVFLEGTLEIQKSIIAGTILE